jgi:hypothetical protein
MRRTRAQKINVLVATMLVTIAQAQAQPVTNVFGSNLRGDRVVREPRRETLEDLFPHTEYKEASLTPLNLKPGKLLPGLNEAAVEKLNAGYFVIVNDARVTNFASIYKQNRIDGLSNFVTVDSIMHPFLAHRNAIKASVTSKSCCIQLKSLLDAMIVASLSDFQETQDEEVKDDIRHNLAFLGVAVRLLAPEEKPKDLGSVEELIRKDLANIQKETATSSAIFRRSENFAAYRPSGWYASSNTLQNFFRCRQWLGSMFLSLTDVTNDSSAGSANEFRQAVLLYRSLVRAKLLNGQGFSTWEKLYKAIALVEDYESSQLGQDLLPDDFARAFLASEKSLKLTLDALSNPLTRTKLLLSLKSAGNKQFSSTSIFQLSARNQKEARNLVFRLFPPFNPPEFDWLNAQIVPDKDPTTGFAALPVGLVVLHARGFAMANNILADNTWRLDPDLIYSVPTLDSLIPDPRHNPSSRSIWQILGSYGKPLPDSVPASFRTTLWASSCLRGTVSGWIDNLVALDKSGTGEAKERASANPAIRKVSNFNYLEPAPEVFKRMSVGLVEFSRGLNELGVFPPDLKEKTADFYRLADRLCEIAKRESANMMLERDDAQLLANIDRLLDKISSPTAGAVFVQYATSRPSYGAAPSAVPPNSNITLRSRPPEGKMTKIADSGTTVSKFKGVNLGLGGPGSLYVLLKGSRGTMLCRGAVYSYYEAPGDAITPAHWQRMVDYGLLKPPFWCDPFQLVDHASAKR